MFPRTSKEIRLIFEGKSWGLPPASLGASLAESVVVKDGLEVGAVVLMQGIWARLAVNVGRLFFMGRRGRSGIGIPVGKAETVSVSKESIACTQSESF